MQYMHDLGGEGEVLQLAWRIVNDSLRTDVCLLFPPYEIALGESSYSSIDLSYVDITVKSGCSGININESHSR